MNLPTLLPTCPAAHRELAHLVRLMEPPEKEGSLDIPGLATLNGARGALKAALAIEKESK
jgi:hypothetical protein